MSEGVSMTEAEAALAGRDQVLDALMAQFGPCRLVGRRARTGHFESLASAIVYQQLAGGAAEVIWSRVRALVDGPFTPQAVATLPEEALRGAGLSGAKARSVADLAERVMTKQLRLASIGRRSDAQVVEELSKVRGIGRWTAEMFLMFQLGRLDVWPTGDLGVRKGYALAWQLPALPTPLDLEGSGERFRPFRSVVAWYCWRAVETVTLERW